MSPEHTTSSSKLTQILRKHGLKLSFVLVTLLICSNYLYTKDTLFTLIALCGLVNVLLLGHSSKAHPVGEFFADPLSQVSITGTTLTVKQHQLDVAAINKVVLDRLDDNEGLLDFPFNRHQKTAMRFPAEQLPAVRQWLQTHLPKATIIR